jgi:hypothetical protein
MSRETVKGGTCYGCPELSRGDPEGSMDTSIVV